jgi:hypothetical protein
MHVFCVLLAALQVCVYLLPWWAASKAPNLGQWLIAGEKRRRKARTKT